MSEPNLSAVLSRADEYLDTEKQVQGFTALGEKLFAQFGAEDNDRVSSQVRNLEQLVVSARRLSDVEVFVKNQMGKKSGEINRKWQRIGDDILNHLETLRGHADSLTNDQEYRLRVRLHLARGWVRAVVGAYLFAKAHKEMEAANAQPGP